MLQSIEGDQVSSTSLPSVTGLPVETLGFIIWRRRSPRPSGR